MGLLRMHMWSFVLTPPQPRHWILTDGISPRVGGCESMDVRIPELNAAEGKTQPSGAQWKAENKNKIRTGLASIQSGYRIDGWAVFFVVWIWGWIYRGLGRPYLAFRPELEDRTWPIGSGV